MKKLIILLLLLIVSLGAIKAQDTLQTNRGVVGGRVIDVNKPQKFYDPRKASIRSALLPGLGQIYNDSWWKVPIVYAGLGTSVYFISFNHDKFQEWQKKAEDEAAKPPDEIDDNALRQYRARADTWRKNRDLVFMVTLGIYGLQIIEASIDAHLKGFDVDENLALNIKPKVGVINNGTPYVGIGITLPIGK